MLLGLSTPTDVEEPRLMKKDRVIHNKSVGLQEATQGLKDVYKNTARQPILKEPRKQSSRPRGPREPIVLTALILSENDSGDVGDFEGYEQAWLYL